MNAGEMLLPCPFCGGVDLECWGDEDRGYVVSCNADDCGVITSEFKCHTPSDAAVKWNRRTPADAAHRAREEAVRELVEACEDYFRPPGKIAEIVAKQQQRLGRVSHALAALTHPAPSDAGAGSGEE